MLIWYISGHSVTINVYLVCAWTFLNTADLLSVLAFVQPERINPEAGNQGYDIKSDVWSLGITMVSSFLHPVRTSCFKQCGGTNHVRCYSQTRCCVLYTNVDISMYESPVFLFISICSHYTYIFFLCKEDIFLLQKDICLRQFWICMLKVQLFDWECHSVFHCFLFCL